MSIGGRFHGTCPARMTGAVAVACLLAGPLAAQDLVASAAAQDGLAGQFAATAWWNACLRGITQGADCIGAEAGRCLFVDGERTTILAERCFGEEATHWQARLDAADDQLRQRASMIAGEAHALDLDQWSARFDRLQSNFLAYRAALCDAQGGIWPGMTGSGEAGAECRMDVTARHALRLEQWVGVTR